MRAFPFHITITNLSGGDEAAIGAAYATALIHLAGSPDLDSALALAHNLVSQAAQADARRRMFAQARAPLASRLAELDEAMRKAA